MNNLINIACTQSMQEQKPIKVFLTSIVVEGTVTDIQGSYVEMRTSTNKRITIKLDCVQAIERD